MVRVSHPFVVYISPSNFFAANGIFIRWMKTIKAFKNIELFQFKSLS
jgi:hypothetical protein